MTGAVVLATDQGLGYLAKDFYDNGLIDKVLIQKHSSRVSHTEWYKDWKWLDKANYEWFFDGLDSLIFFETPFDWHLIPLARENAVKTILMPMHECTQYPFPYSPDLLIAPSLLEVDLYKGQPMVFQRVPVSSQWKLREKARVFVHNAGNGGLGGRNGTKELLEAMKYVKSPIKLIIRTQEKDFSCSDPRVEVRKGTFDRETLYGEGDVFIFPEKFNGLSLPLQEAFASGMAVMATNRYPMNTWLPTELLIEPSGYKKERIAVEFESAVISPEAIAARIDELYNKDITKYSLMGKMFSERTSWGVLKEFYQNTLCDQSQ